MDNVLPLQRLDNLWRANLGKSFNVKNMISVYRMSLIRKLATILLPVSFNRPRLKLLTATKKDSRVTRMNLPS